MSFWDAIWSVPAGVANFFVAAFTEITPLQIFQVALILGVVAIALIVVWASQLMIDFQYDGWRKLTVIFPIILFICVAWALAATGVWAYNN